MRRLVTGLACLLVLSSQPLHSEPRPLGWEELVPQGWPDRDPLDGQDINSMADGDPKAQVLYAALRDYLDNAPVVAALDGQDVSIPGYVVPLEFGANSQEIRQFLLVPYYGACIHTPPPASNQIVLVDAESSVADFPANPQEPVTVTGQLRIQRAQSELGASSYQLNATTITAYTN